MTFSAQAPRKPVSWSCTLLVLRRLSELQQGTYTKPTKETVGKFLEQWLTGCAQGKLSARTYHRYAEIIRLHINPTLGACPLQSLRALQIQALYTSLLESGRADGNGGLAPQTVLHVHRLLHEALDQALKWDMIVRNPVDGAEPPTVRRQEMKTWDKEQAAAALDAAEGEWLYMPLMLALGTGMRAGEILALQWGDIDFQSGILTCRRSAAVANNRTATPIIYKAPKTNRARSMTLPASLIDALNEHLEKQRELYALLGKNHTPTALVVSDADGSGLKPSIMGKRFESFIQKAGLARIRFHDLRHTHATALLSLGENAKTIADRLGHSTVNLTLNTYSHVTASMQQETARKADSFLHRERKPIRLEKAS